MSEADDLLDAFFPYRRRYETYTRIPAEGVPREDVISMLDAMSVEEDALAHAGKCSGSIYHGGADHYAFLAQAFQRFLHANVLQRDMYPSASKFESEIVGMTASLLHGDPAEGTCGVVTFGGTESLLDAVFAYRERGRRAGIERPRVVMPRTGHVAVDKACHYFGVELDKAPVDGDFRVDLEAVRAAIGPDTVALFGSAANYPHGVVDDVEGLSELALEHELGLHVDGCLGGFILPWGERLGIEVPAWDFRVPGVTSISADTHKYGYGPKGTGVLLYRDRDLRREQYFAVTDWPGGLYASPGLAGSRSGGLIAATWAAMVALGETGYLEAARRIFETAAEVRAAVEEHPELYLIGQPTFLVAFGSHELDVFHLNDRLRELGWRMNGLQRPPGLHFCVTLPNTQPGVAEAFAADLRDAVAYAKDPPSAAPRSGALYGGGAGEGAPDVRAALEGALDAMYEPAPPL